MSLIRIVAPVNLAVSLTDIKAYLRIDGATEDSIITTMIKSATNLVENYIERALITQQWRKTWDGFPTTNKLTDDVWYNGTKEIPIQFAEIQNRFLQLNRGLLQTVESVVTVDDSNAENTFASSNYYVDTKSLRPRVILNDGAIWPTSLRDFDSVYAEFTSGYGLNDSDIPDDIKQSIMFSVVDIYENRCPSNGGALSMSIKEMLAPYIVREL